MTLYVPYGQQNVIKTKALGLVLNVGMSLLKICKAHANKMLHFAHELSTLAIVRYVNALQPISLFYPIL